MKTISQKQPSIRFIVEAPAGAHIGNAVREATELSRRLGCPVAFKFNGVDVTVAEDMDPTDVIARYFERQQQ